MDRQKRPEFTVKPADLNGHVAQIKTFIEKLNVHLKLPSGAMVSTEQLKSDLAFGHCHSLVAVKDGTEEIIGHILYYHGYSTCVTEQRMIGRFIYMEDFFVLDEYRGCGVGTALWAELAKMACAQNIIRIQWAVLDWNTDAIAFYKKHGAVNVRETDGDSVFRLTQTHIENLAKLAINN